MQYVALGALPLALLVAGAVGAAESDTPTSLENETLRISLAVQDASLTVADRRIGLVWRQRVTPGFRVVASSVAQSPGKLSAEVTGQGGPYSLTISLAPDRPHGFDLALHIPGRKHTAPPAYPFPFAAPPGDWWYVQNTTGEGMLMPLAKPDKIKDLYQWNGGQPWWGLTDLERSMFARLDSFRSQAARATVYAVPMR